jgi:hypothetical protein
MYQNSNLMSKKTIILITVNAINDKQMVLHPISPPSAVDCYGGQVEKKWSSI